MEEDIVKEFLIGKLVEEIVKAKLEAERLGKWNPKCKPLQDEWKKVMIGIENPESRSAVKEKIGREKLYKCLNLTAEWCQLAKKAAECCPLLKEKHKLNPKTLHLPFQDKLGQIINQVKKDLEDSAKEAQTPPQQQQQQQQQPSSTLNITEIYRWSSHKNPAEIRGFDDKIKVMQRLLLEKETKAIGISGVAGVGKTVLAQGAYNDPTVKKQFLLRMWLCMSKQHENEDPVKRMLTCLGFERHVIEKIGEKKLRPAIQQQLNRGRFLIVLDDVWADDEKWDSSFLTKDCGEGKVIVTSRSPKLEQVVGPNNITQRLLPLPDSDDSCWKIFIDALGKDATPEEKLKPKIVKKCEGLPLMAKMLGKYGTAINGQDAGEKM